MPLGRIGHSVNLRICGDKSRYNLTLQKLMLEVVVLRNY